MMYKEFKVFKVFKVFSLYPLYILIADKCIALRLIQLIFHVESDFFHSYR